MPRVLTDIICRIIGHKTLGIGVSYDDWKATGFVLVCYQCGKGASSKGWTKGGLDKIRSLHPEWTTEAE